MHFSVLMAHRGHTAVHSGEKALELYSENLPAERQVVLIQELFC